MATCAAGARAVLVDDVYTTGATLDACAAALRAAGSGPVTAVCFARTRPCRGCRWRRAGGRRSMGENLHIRIRTTQEVARVRIEIRGRNTAVTDTLRRHVEERFTTRIGKQVSELAQLEVELLVEKNPAIADDKVAEATLHLKGVTLRAREASSDLSTRSTWWPTSSRARSSATATSAGAAASASAAPTGGIALSAARAAPESRPAAARARC